MKRLMGASVLLAASLGSPGPALAQIRVHPTGVNVNANGATTVFLTFGSVRNHRPAEAFWCGKLVSAAPDRGLKCDPATIFGRLPIRFDLSTRSGTTGFTDIMSIPESVARRARQAAAEGARSSFFYVRRFVSLTGGPDEYVAVTCRFAGGGARAYNLGTVPPRTSPSTRVWPRSSTSRAPFQPSRASSSRGGWRACARPRRQRERRCRKPPWATPPAGLRCSKPCSRTTRRTRRRNDAHSQDTRRRVHDDGLDRRVEGGRPDTCPAQPEARVSERRPGKRQEAGERRAVPRSDRQRHERTVTVTARSTGPCLEPPWLLPVCQVCSGFGIPPNPVFGYSDQSRGTCELKGPDGVNTGICKKETTCAPGTTKTARGGVWGCEGSD